MCAAARPRRCAEARAKAGRNFVSIGHEIRPGRRGGNRGADFLVHDQRAPASRRLFFTVMGTSRRRAALGAAVIALIVPGGALAAFPGTNPDESVRVNAPNDPGYDP